jgi:uncharacterized protein YgiM (DUF1202 family)
MLRLTLLLCIGMFAALMIAGEDRGQMRPGLVAAAAKKVQPEEVTGVESQLILAPETTRAAADPVAAVAAADPVVDQPAPTLAASEAANVAYVEPERNLVTAVQEPVFSLSALGNETPPSAPDAPQPEVAAGGEGTIWYVNASSVNVRAEPSTQAEVVGKLASGEAALMVQAVDEDWARIVIQGDGVEGFVAMRYLSAEAP